LREMRLKELRDELRDMRDVNALSLQARVRQAIDDGAGNDLLDALEGAPTGFPIVPTSVVQEARERIALQAHPELSELAQLRDAYKFAINAARQIIREASGLNEFELRAEPTRQPAHSEGD